MTLLVVTWLLGALLPPVAGSTPRSDGTDAIAKRLDPSTAVAVRAVIDQAKADALPVDPLIATALEGAARSIPSDRIIAAVRAQAAALAQARTALGRSAPSGEIIAGASALRAGIVSDSLAALHRASMESVVIPLVVMTDMAARGVPPASAAGAVLGALRAHVVDKDLLRLREFVAEDIRAGASPAAAAAVRTQAILLESPGPARAGGASRSHKEAGP
jgi:hypothetical protein